jgi:hypothetical protein
MAKEIKENGNAVKGNDPVQVEQIAASKFHKVGDKYEVHKNVAAKLVEKKVAKIVK